MSGEIGSIVVSLPYIQSMFGDIAYYTMLCALPLYVVGLPTMYMYMLSQRKKVLGGGVTTLTCNVDAELIFPLPAVSFKT